MNGENKTHLIIILIVLVIIICIVYVEPNENFKGYFEDPDIDLLDINTDIMNNVGVQHLRATDFSEIVNEMKEIIFRKVIEYGELCKGTNGLDILQKTQYSLGCYSDVAKIEDGIVMEISRYVIDYIKVKFNVNINPYQIVDDMKNHLELLETVIYPLSNTGLYTLYGEQYFTKSTIKRIINNDFLIKNVLYTTLSRRGIDVIIDDDKNIN
jgi:hypothetical protein